MRSVFTVTAAFVLLCLGIAASSAITIDTVRVGDPGNVADSASYGSPGSVGYTYNIGKYEVTAGQYCAFLNAVAKTDTYGLYNTTMARTDYGSGISRNGSSDNFSYTVNAAFVNRPVNYVSYWDSCRFANWLVNAQKTGAQDLTTTEDGTYYLNGYVGNDGRTIQRKAGSTWAVTSQDEWFKAAYYKGGGTDAGYWLYPTHSDTAPGRDTDDVSGNNANYYYSNPFPIQSPYYTTVVGEFQNSGSAYGTFDQGGNVWEWNEAQSNVSGQNAYREWRGGGFDQYDYCLLSDGDGFGYITPVYEYCSFGFRVSQAVPEPYSLITLAGGLMTLCGLRRRRA